MTNTGPVYLDCSATTPVEPAVLSAMRPFWEEEFGNAGSRTHAFGARALAATQRARDAVAVVVGARREEVVFTSGATEANNLALLGLAAAGERAGRRHVVSTAMEHKAVLEPLDALARRGFEVELLSPDADGRVSAARVAGALRADTLLVSVMHANNETGMLNPVAEIAAALRGHVAWLHVDAAQTFGRADVAALRDPRVELISVSGHKVFGPKGVGALITRRRGFERPSLEPLMFGGGQERGLRPGTLPVPLLVGFGVAAELAVKEHAERTSRCEAFGARLMEALEPLRPERNGDGAGHALANVVNLSFPGVDSEALMVALKDVVAISNGSACTSAGHRASHVLQAMGLPPERIRGATRWSWCHRTPEPDWTTVRERIGRLAGSR